MVPILTNTNMYSFQRFSVLLSIHTVHTHLLFFYLFKMNEIEIQNEIDWLTRRPHRRRRPRCHRSCLIVFLALQSFIMHYCKHTYVWSSICPYSDKRNVSVARLVRVYGEEKLYVGYIFNYLGCIGIVDFDHSARQNLPWCCPLSVV